MKNIEKIDHRAKTWDAGTAKRIKKLQEGCIKIKGDEKSKKKGKPWRE